MYEHELVYIYITGIYVTTANKILLKTRSTIRQISFF